MSIYCLTFGCIRISFYSIFPSQKGPSGAGAAEFAGPESSGREEGLCYRAPKHQNFDFGSKPQAYFSKAYELLKRSGSRWLWELAIATVFWC